jgi:hypothetical protein
MSGPSYNEEILHERVSFGENAPSSTRRSGVVLSQPGHFMAIASISSAAADSTEPDQITICYRELDIGDNDDCTLTFIP